MDWLFELITREIGFETLIYIVLPVLFTILTVSFAAYKTHKRHHARMKKLEQEYFKV